MNKTDKSKAAHNKISNLFMDALCDDLNTPKAISILSSAKKSKRKIVTGKK